MLLRWLATSALLFAANAGIVAACAGGEPRPGAGAAGSPLLPLEPPPGYVGSCAEQLRTWRAVRLNPDSGTPFLCFDVPRNGQAARLGAPVLLRGWAGYPAEPDTFIQLQIADTMGRRALVGLRRHIEGYGGSFRLVPFVEDAPLPRDTVPGETVRVHVIIANREGNSLASGEVSVLVTR